VVEHVDQDYLTANNITFFSAQGCNSMAVAEFIISAIVNLADELGFDYTQKTKAKWRMKSNNISAKRCA
jgi:erythronate-4-phosphate dehydrogenase